MQRCNRRSRKDFLRLFVAQRKTLQSTYSSISQRKVHMLPQNPLFFQIIPTTKQTNPPPKNLILSPRKSWIPRLTPFSRSEFLFSPTESILLTSGWRKINDVCECKSASWATEVKTRWISVMRMAKMGHQRPDFFCHGPLCRLLSHWRQTSFKLKKKKTFHQNQITEHACWVMELHGGQKNAQNQTRICLSKGPTLSVGVLSHLSVTTGGGEGGGGMGGRGMQRGAKCLPHVPD